MVRKQWTCVGVKTSVPWPISETTVEFEGHKIILRPETDTLACSIAFEHGSAGISREDAKYIIRRFMSALSWIEGAGISETFWAGGGGPTGIGKSPNNSISTTKIDPLFLPNPQEQKSKLALALYREALSVNSIPYKFLGFVKILNILVSSRTQHKDWIEKNIGLLKNSDALGVVERLKSKNVDIGEHIYVSGRCAIAHAHTDPIVDPDSSEDRMRLIEELPLIKELAEIAMEKDMGIKSQRTIYREHLYELSGFKQRLPKEWLEKAVRGESETLNADEIPFTFSIGLRQKSAFPSFKKMRATEVQVEGHLLIIVLSTVNEGVKAKLSLSIKDEHLHFDPFKGLAYFDVGTKACLLDQVDALNFCKETVLNGAIQVTADDTNETLGRKNPYLGVNIDLGRTIESLEADIAKLTIEAEKRNN